MKFHIFFVENFLALPATANSGAKEANVLESVLTSRRGPISKYGVEIVRKNYGSRELTAFAFAETARIGLITNFAIGSSA